VSAAGTCKWDVRICKRKKKSHQHEKTKLALELELWTVNKETEAISLPPSQCLTLPSALNS
jgi:hypothetical protein